MSERENCRTPIGSLHATTYTLAEAVREKVQPQGRPSPEAVAGVAQSELAQHRAHEAGGSRKGNQALATHVGRRRAVGDASAESRLSAMGVRAVVALATRSR